MPQRLDDEESIAGLIRRECGDEIADRFLEAFAGVRCNIPSDPSKISKQSRLLKVFGEETARQIAMATGYVSEIIPMGEAKGFGFKRREAEALLRKGQSLRNVALAVGVHERSVTRWRSEMTKTARKRASTSNPPVKPLQKKA